MASGVIFSIYCFYKYGSGVYGSIAVLTSTTALFQILLLSGLDKKSFSYGRSGAYISFIIGCIWSLSFSIPVALLIYYWIYSIFEISFFSQTVCLLFLVQNVASRWENYAVGQNNYFKLLIFRLSNLIFIISLIALDSLDVIGGFERFFYIKVFFGSLFSISFLLPSHSVDWSNNGKSVWELFKSTIHTGIKFSFAPVFAHIAPQLGLQFFASAIGVDGFGVIHIILRLGQVLSNLSKALVRVFYFSNTAYKLNFNVINFSIGFLIFVSVIGVMIGSVFNSSLAITAIACVTVNLIVSPVNSYLLFKVYDDDRTKDFGMSANLGAGGSLIITLLASYLQSNELYLVGASSSVLFSYLVLWKSYAER